MDKVFALETSEVWITFTQGHSEVKWTQMFVCVRVHVFMLVHVCIHVILLCVSPQCPVSAVATPPNEVSVTILC